MTRLLTAKQRTLLGVVVVLSFWLLVNSAYLFLTSPSAAKRLAPEKRYEVSTYGMIGQETITAPPVEPEKSLPVFYQIMLLSHLVCGVTLLVIALGFVAWHIPAAWKRANQRAIVMGIGLTLVAVFLALSGLFILTEANSLHNRWIFYSHRVLAVALPLLYISHRLAAFSPVNQRRLAYAAAGAAVLLLAMLGLHRMENGRIPRLDFSLSPPHLAYAAEMQPGAEPKANALPDDPFIPFKPYNTGTPDSRFAPSAATTSSGDYMPRRQLTLEDVSDPETIANDLKKYGFVVSESMGSATCKRCHAGIVEQWSRSAHRFSSFNNLFYKSTVENLRSEENGKQRSQWCAGCHDPVLMFGGKMLDEVDPLWPESQAGLTCLSCHTIDAIHGKKGNGNYNISDKSPSPYLFNEAKEGVEKTAHDFLIKSKPTVHKNQMLKPFYRTSEYCMTCHKVSLDVPINHYKWLRGQDDYDAWHDSGVALNASRTFYLPPKKRMCQDCHMPLEKVTEPDVSAKNGMVKSHTFFSANTALPYVRGDKDAVEKVEKFLTSEKVVIDLFALRFDGGAEPRPTGYSEVAVKSGQTVQADVVVRNLGVGHAFPGGTIDSNETWIHFQVLDDSGAVLYESGGLDENKVVDPAAHFYKVLFVSKEGKPALVRDPQNFHAPVYVRVIGPGTDDLVQYRFFVPPEWDGKRLTLRASLMWRKFNTPFTEFVQDREKFHFIQGKFDLPITTLSMSETVFTVGDRPSRLEHGTSGDPRPDWIRYNDYGIANILQQNNQLAKWAFEQVDRLQPEKVDGPRNLARIAINEGDLMEAYRLLGECEIRKPGDPQTAWFWGLAKQDDGDYEAAAKAYERVLAYFPEDRASWRQLGRTLYLNGDYADSLRAFLNVLAIDPEDRVAHYHRMLIYRALGEKERADAAQEAYEKYQVDENANEFTQQYRRDHPLDNAASQTIRVIELQPVKVEI
ncbi:MAG: tetratricopeptide repeat protein [bacterium]|nr:tetratricopeptide repeat protein [bacterium]